MGVGIGLGWSNQQGLAGQHMKNVYMKEETDDILVRTYQRSGHYGDLRTDQKIKTMRWKGYAKARGWNAYKIWSKSPKKAPISTT